MATARKRARPALEETQAECVYTVEHPNPNDKEKKQKKRRRTGSDGSPARSPTPLQASPFAPAGKFQKDPDNNMDRHYKVNPAREWSAMTRYNSFVLNGVKYFSEGFVFVANSFTVDRSRSTGEARAAREKSKEDWVARILEIRASDEHHVYARVYWLYWPDELPARTLYKGRTVSGRQPYHGYNELIASNHMDVINVVSVTAPAIVNQWIEENEEEVQQALYWRQAIDVRTMELSSVQERCVCNEPENPDKYLIRCSNDKCGMWLHDDCLAHQALLDTFSQLGTDKPYIPTALNDGEENDGPKQPLSPSETGAAQTAQQSIDVKPEEKTIKLSDVETPSSMANLENLDLRSIPVAPGSKKRSRSRKSADSELDDKPYLGFFKASVTNEAGKPPVMEITDLRHDILGGESSWKEPVKCLTCREAIQ